MQEPVTIELGVKYKYVLSGAKRRLAEKPDTFQYVPLINNLQWLFHNRDICSQVNSSATGDVLVKLFLLHAGIPGSYNH